MFFPYGTDAPVYYWPFTTVVLIALNLLATVAVVTNPGCVSSWVLTYGDGLHPLQWVTSNFIHAGLWHLVGNMACLWTFGLVVEGKLGWYKTLAVYLGIGVTQCAVEQVLMLGASEGGSCGASAIIFGFMAMSLIWAPENDIHCVVLFGFRSTDFDMTIYSLVGSLLLVELGFGLLTPMSLTSQALHLMGAAVGFPLAIWMLKAGIVDCENWDIFSVFKGRNRMTREELAQEEAERPENRQQQVDEHERQMQTSLGQIRQIIQDQQAALAIKLHQRWSRELKGWCLPEADLLALIHACHAKKLWVDSVPLMREYLSRYKQKAVAIRLRLAKIFVTEDLRPAQALRVLARVDPNTLAPAQRELFAELRAKARQLHEEDPYEIVDDDWA